MKSLLQLHNGWHGLQTINCRENGSTKKRKMQVYHFLIPLEIIIEAKNNYLQLLPTIIWMVLEVFLIAKVFLVRDMKKLKTFYANRKRLNSPKKPQTKEIESNYWQNFEEESLSGLKRKIDDSGREEFMSPSGDYFRERFSSTSRIKISMKRASQH